MSRLTYRAAAGLPLYQGQSLKCLKYLPRTDCPRAEGLGEEESTHVRLAMWEIEVEEMVEGMVEGIFGRVMEAERARAATVIQRE